MYLSKEYRAWESAKQRCFNPNASGYENYGGRGVTVCPEWVGDFQAFYDHIGPQPDDGQRWSLDRIDTNGNYEPGNVQWATDKQQGRNRRKRLDNSSGVNGVGIHLCKGKHEYAVATWLNIEGKPCTKHFSIRKYGREAAIQLASEHRAKMIALLNEQGAGFTEAHGK